MMVTGSDSASCGIPFDARLALENISVEQILRRSFRPSLEDAVAQCGVAATDQRRRAVFHHGDEFGRRLARVKWNYDQTFRHDREIERDPVDAVRREQGAAVAFL